MTHYMECSSSECPCYQRGFWHGYDVGQNEDPDAVAPPAVSAPPRRALTEQQGSGVASRCPSCGATWGSIEAGHGHLKDCQTKGAPRDSS